MIFIPVWLFWLVFAFACLGLFSLLLSFLSLVFVIWVSCQFEPTSQPDLPRLKKKYAHIDTQYR